MRSLKVPLANPNNGGVVRAPFCVQLYLTMRQRMKQKDPPQDETLTTFQRVAWILTLFD